MKLLGENAAVEREELGFGLEDRQHQEGSKRCESAFSRVSYAASGRVCCCGESVLGCCEGSRTATSPQAPACRSSDAASECNGEVNVEKDYTA